MPVNTRIAQISNSSLGCWLRSFFSRDVVLVAVVAALTLFLEFHGERVPVNGGFGWDGVLYASWARDFPHEVFGHRVNNYYIQRVLPSAVVHYSLRTLGIPPTDAAILRGFGICAVLMHALAACCWCLIARDLRLSLAGKWFGFIALFVNYIVLKYTRYCVVGTEASAYLLGLMMLLCCLRRWRALLAIVTVVGGFVWPTAVYVGAALLVFPRTRSADGPVPPAPRLAGALTAILVILAGLGIWFVLQTPPSLQTIMVANEFSEPYRPALPLSVAVALAYLGAAFYPLLNGRLLYELRALVTRRRVLIVGIVLVGLLALKFVQGSLSRPEPTQGLGVFLRQTAYTSLVRPGIFLVTHVAFYGPFFLLTAFFWRQTVRQIHGIGIGLTLAVAVGLLFSLNSQSRFFMNIFPMVLPFVVKVIDERRISALQFGFTAIAAVLLSKVWFTINSGQFHGRLSEFPDQGLFMTHGPWISPLMYAVQGIVFLILGAAMWAIFFRPRRSAVAFSHPLPQAVAGPGIEPSIVSASVTITS
jgi:hypothetical protein